MRKQDKRLSRDQRDRREISGHIVRYGLIQPLRQNRARLHEQQSVSVGGRLSDQIGTYHGTGTRSIFHDDRLLQLLLQLPGQNPCCCVDPSARSNRHHQRYCPRWIGLRRCDPRDQRSGGTSCQM
jgi:hypothetical protein